jgi:hypothetical protein
MARPWSADGFGSVASGASKNFDLYGDGAKAAISVQNGTGGAVSLSSTTSQLAQALSQFDANGWQ